MHNAPDRDRFIRINWENMREDRVSSFSLQRSSQVSSFNVAYDGRMSLRNLKFQLIIFLVSRQRSPLQRQSILGQRSADNDGALQSVPSHHGSAD